MATPLLLTPDAVNSARDTLRAGRQTLIKAINDVTIAQAALDDALRTVAEDPGKSDNPVTMARAELQKQQDALTDARTAERTLRDALAAAIGDWLKDGAAPVTPEADVARLQASQAIVLFPVRLETRFDTTATPPNLRIRFYPDEISLDIHERALTQDEADAGRRFYDGRALTDDVEEKKRWQDLAGRFGAPRAAYIARVMRPILLGDGAGYASPYGSSFAVCGTDWLTQTPPATFTYPDVPLRPDVWTRPGEAVLPDRWVVAGYRAGKKVFQKAGNPIPEPLALTYDPGGAAASTADGFNVDQDLLWTIEYDTALQIGMAMTITTDNDPLLLQGYDRLVVVGVKSSLLPLVSGSADQPPGAPPADAAMYLEHLFDAHHYTRGLALVPQGTPTNNLSGSPTPFPPDDPFGGASFSVERDPPPFHRTISYHCPTDGGDIDPLAETLGVPNGVFRNVFGARQANSVPSGDGFSTDEAGEQRRADLMNAALWPITWGYFLEQMMTPVFAANLDTIESVVRPYFRRFVRARGPAPAIRVGNVPYGVLPAVSLDSWSAENNNVIAQTENSIVRRLRRLREVWKAAAASKAARIAPAGAKDPLTSLVNVLAQEASSRQLRVRGVIGADAVTNMGSFLGLIVSEVISVLANSAVAATDLIGEKTWRSARVLGATLANGADLFPGPLVTAEQAVPKNYLNGLRSADADALQKDTVVTTTNKPLLYLLIRAALMSEYARIARRKGLLFHLEIEFFGLLDIEIGARFFDVLKANLTTLRNDLAIFNYLGILSDLAEELDAVSTDEAERLLTETLDLASHRLDAWITALATRRLGDMRRVQQHNHNKPVGSYVGGFSWVENLRVASSTAPNGGFIHAPSMPQAAAAAVLRSGFQSGGLEAAEKYAVDLSSERVRIGRRILDEIREGQPLGAVLGYRFERAMRDSHGTVVGLETYLLALRKLYPLVANKSQTDNNAPVDKIAARNVVDGLALRADHKLNHIPFGSNGLPNPNGPPDQKAAFNAIVAELNALDNLVDAVSDLVTSESVYQLVRGNMAGAGATLDSLARGQRPPDPEIARSPRGGAGVTHRIALAFTANSSEPTGWFVPVPAKLSERIARSADLDRVIGTLIGNASKVKAVVKYKIKDKDKVKDKETNVYLGPNKDDVDSKNLEIRPLDLVAMARASTTENKGSLLDRFIIEAALADQTGAFDVTVTYDNGPLNFPKVMEMARAVGAALAGTRLLSADDLVVPAESSASSEGGAGADAQALLTSAQAAQGKLDKTRTDLDPLLKDPVDISEVRAQLKIAATYDPALFPDALAGDNDLVAAAAAASTQLARRSAAATAASAGGSGTNADLIRTASAMFQAIFGRDFFPGSTFTPGNASELVLSLADRASLLPNGSEAAPLQMLEQTARVREPLSRYRRVALYGGMLGTPSPSISVVQLPFVKGEGWVGPRPQGSPPTAGRVSCLLLVPSGATLDPSASLQGLVLDEWVETVPAATEETGVAFHFDNPGAEAPQGILVAVPASGDGVWKFADLLNTVNESLDLAQIRAVEPEHLPFGQALPAIYVTRNGDDATPTTEFPSVATDFAIGAKVS